MIIPGGITEYLKKDLLVEKLNELHPHLWWAGRFGNIRPLHKQKMMHRNIIITENPDLHMVWYDSTIYIKPMPKYLLDKEFFREYIFGDPELRRSADGFLLSYSKLICHESDFNVATETGLLSGTDWPTWCRFASGFRNIEPHDANKRYHYGEIRLRRLNQICIFLKWRWSYYSVYTQYDHFFGQNFGWMILLFAYLTIILAAMQVVLATPSFTHSFESVSYWFGVFSILVVVGGASIILALFTILLTYNLVITLRDKHKHGRKMIEPKTEEGISKTNRWENWRDEMYKFPEEKMKLAPVPDDCNINHITATSP